MNNPMNFDMKQILIQLTFLIITASLSSAQQMRTFSNAKGEKLEDRILKYNYEDRVVSLARSGKIPLDAFSKADQDYILLWNQIEGFKTGMRFKIAIEKDTWERMKHEQTITPFFMDAVQVPGKQTPAHNVFMIEDYEEYNAMYFEAEGYSITLHNQNFFPIENILVESKVFYEQEYYVVPDDIFESMESEYDNVATTNKVRFVSETVPVIIPREKVTVHSDCAIIVDHQVDRNSLVTTEDEEGEDDDGGDEDDDGGGEEEAPEAIVEGLGDIDDHGRRRRGKTIGAWFRIGIKGLDGEMIWREMTEPSSLAKKMSWDPAAEAAE
jgi:hypothetical protein